MGIELARAAETLAEFGDRLRMHDNANLTLDDVLVFGRRAIEKNDCRLIATDYIQRMKITATERDEAIRLRIGRASTGLANLVKNTQCHSLLLSQINSGRKGGVQAIPTMFDFRESAQIENDAHTIILMHREWDEKNGYFSHRGAFFVPKQRFGSPCNLKAWFDPVTASWMDHDPLSEQQCYYDEK
jgi:replicative DNA helicase